MGIQKDDKGLMNRPVAPVPGDEAPDEPNFNFKHGEGAQSALAAMIRKRQMDENHVEVVSGPPPLSLPTPE